MFFSGAGPHRIRTARVLATLGSSLVLLAGALATCAQAGAEGVLHQVKYTVFSEQPFAVEIYYRDSDPPTFAEYSHDPYRYSPNVEADVGPDKMWTVDVMLADPTQWAMVVASTGGESPKSPNIHCVLAVDGAVVATNQGPKGALCSLRNW
jgi:hypothetical protein